MVKASIHRKSIIALHQKGIRQNDIVSRLSVSKSFVSETISRFKALGTTLDRAGRGRKATVVTPVNIKRVRERLRYKDTRSQRKMGKDMGISRGSMWRIINDKLKIKAYKLAKGQFLTDESKKKREVRAQQLLHRFSGIDYRKILFTDEKVFTVEQAKERN